jgi:hypothetical protein
MKKIKSGATFFFVDESGDPTFYDHKGNLIVGHEGCSSLLILGLVEISDPITNRTSFILPSEGPEAARLLLKLLFKRVFINSNRNGIQL